MGRGGRLARTAELNTASLHFRLPGGESLSVAIPGDAHISDEVIVECCDVEAWRIDMIETMTPVMTASFIV